MRLLLHCCCGPCSLEVAEHFRSLGYEVVAWFFNPNIHPPEELARRQAAMERAAGMGASAIPRLCSGQASCQGNEPHPASCNPPEPSVAAPSPRAERGKGVRFDRRSSTLFDFLLHLARSQGMRCRACYRLRLEAAAQEAAARGCEAFSTTLTISPYQDLRAIQEVGESAGAKCGVRFVYADLRDHYHASTDRARELGLYRQNYCGCLFSRLERAERRSRRAISKTL